MAKCNDLKLTGHQEPLKRFFEYCNKSISNRAIKMNEQGFGPESAKVIADIFKGRRGCNVEPWSLDLGKNRLGNKGIEIIAKGVQSSKSLAALDLGSNDLMHEGATILFRCLSVNQSLTYLNIANHDRLHRNRLSVSSC